MMSGLGLILLLVSAGALFLAGVWTGRRIEHSRQLAQEDVVWEHLSQTIAECTARREAALFINPRPDMGPILPEGLAKAFHVPAELIVDPNDLPHCQERNTQRIRHDAK